MRRECALVAVRSTVMALASNHIFIEVPRCLSSVCIFVLQRITISSHLTSLFTSKETTPSKSSNMFAYKLYKKVKKDKEEKKAEKAAAASYPTQQPVKIQQPTVQTK